MAIPLEVERALSGWSRSGSGPLYARLADALRSAIRRGELPAGARLPTERALAAALAVSRGTVVAAYDALREDEWVGSRQGSGTWVRRDAPVERIADHRLPHLRSASSFRGLIEGPTDAIDLSPACLPGSDVVTQELMAKAMDDLVGELAGTGYAALGYGALRRAIASYMSSAWGLQTTEEQILVTTGAQQAFGLVTALLARPGDAVVVEDPGFLGALDVLAAAGARAAPAPVGPQGVRVGALSDVVTAEGARLVYLVPTFQNPTGTVLPEAARREVARLADELPIVVVEDQTLADLTLEREPPAPIAVHASEGSVLTIGSLSKLFWGGLRVGWIRAPEHLIARLARLKLVADLGSSMVSQVLAARLLEDVERAKAVRRAQLGERLQVLSGTLREQLPSWRWDRPAGGLALWVRLPFGDARELALAAQRHGVLVLPGPATSPDGGFADHLRIPFVHNPPDIREGVARLARAWEEYAGGAQREGVRVSVVV